MKEMIVTSMPMFVCLFWSIMLALNLWERYRPYNVRLLIFMLTATVLYWGHCVFFNRSDSLIPLSDVCYVTSNLAVYPLYLVYIASLTDRREYHKWHYLLLLPTLVGGLAVALIYCLMSPAETQQFVEQYLYGGTLQGLTGAARVQAYVHNVCKVTFALQIPFVLWQGFRRIRIFNHLVSTVYADTEQRTLHPLRVMLWLFVFTSLVSVLFNAIGRYPFAGSMGILMFPSLLFSVLLFSLGYVGYRQKFSILDVEQDESQTDAVLAESGGDAEASELLQRIRQLVENEQFYLKPDLKIVDLVVKLRSNRSYVYNAINREMGMSFSDYINGLRVQHACRLMQADHSLLMQHVAEQSGFMSMASFYRNFKTVMGLGPKEYLQNLIETS